MPDLSVILPFFNADKTLKRAVESILSQSFKDFELLLIDNSSLDESPDIAKDLATQDSRIRLIHEPQQGVVFAANSGMKAATGKYIARMDADDAAHPERLALQWTHLENKPDISISATQVNYVTEEMSKTEFSHFVDWSNALNTWQDIYENRFVELPVVNPTLMFRKAILKEVGYLEEGDFPEDYEWFLRAVENGHKIEKIQKPLLDWHDGPTRLTRTDARYKTEAFFQIKTEYLARHLKSIGQTYVWIWGAGKLGYQRSQLLTALGIVIAGYIDIKKDKTLKGYSCVHFEDINLSQQPFILSYVSNRGRREEVRTHLKKNGYAEGESFIIAG